MKKRVRRSGKPPPPKKRSTSGRTRRSADLTFAPPAATGDGAGAPAEADAAAPAADVTVVGVGASAGGLEAFSQLLRSLPPDPGVALVLIQHLAPQHESALPDLLSAHTGLPVAHAAEGMQVERNHVYVIPPNAQMGMTEDGVLHLLPRPTDRSQYSPIDYFFTSLAESQQDRAIAVVLSGTASDGTIGVREVKAVGGTTFAQEPATAKYDGMPRAAIATGLVDLVLPPEQIAAEVARLGHRDAGVPVVAFRDAKPAPGHEAGVERMFTLLRNVSGVDFRRYKAQTIERRLRRRMVINRIDRFPEYVALMESRPAEVQELYQDLLIHVTHFFREPATLEVIQHGVFPDLLAGRSDKEPIRAWVAGCASGEEAYSLAILLLETLEERNQSVPIQIFATDLSEAAILRAREGVYQDSIESDVSPERLRRFFTRTDGAWRINKLVRERCVFARQDLTRDPPFSRLDLVLCRNVLIYFGTDLQRRLMGLFHYALKPSGYLVLGRAETIGQYGDLFGQVDKRSRVYRKRVTGSPGVHLPADYSVPRASEGRRPALPGGDGMRRVQNEANRVIQDKYAPPGVIIDGDNMILQFRGQTGPYLEPAPGDPTVNVLKMARDGLLHGLRAALQEARRGHAAVKKAGLRVRANGGWRTLDLEVVPLKAGDAPHFLVLFHEEKGRRGEERKKRAVEKSPRVARKGSTSIVRLEQELASGREYLQSVIQELEAANEELQSANEEILSSNEELQSTNEELDTAKEELQSTNEEINTVNEELQARNDELAHANADFLNLLGSVQIAIVIVGRDLRIRRFTPVAERVLNLIATDVGRPIGHLKPNIDAPDLENLVQEVVDTMVPQECEVRDLEGGTFVLRVRPYKSSENRIEGAVLALIDISGAKRQEGNIQRTQAFVDALVEMVRHPILILDRELRVRTLNRTLCEAFDLHGDQTGRPLGELSKDLKLPRLAELLAVLVADGRPVEGFALDRQRAGSGPRALLLHARRIQPDDGREPLLLVSIEEVRDDAAAR